MRSLVVILLLGMCFLLGVIYANGQVPNFEHSERNQETIDPSDQIKENETAKTPSIDELDLPLKTVAVDENPNATQKLAASLEGIVNGFYDMIVDLMYAFSEMFF